MTAQHSYRDVTISAGVYCIIATCFFIPLSTSLLGIGSVLALLFWFLSGKFLQLPNLMRENAVILYSTTLFILFTIGLGYTVVPLDEGIRILAKYRELIFIPMVFMLLANHGKGRRLAENSFVAGCIILMLISYGIYFSILPEFKYGNSIIHHISHSFFMALLGFWALQRSMDAGRYRYLWAMLFVATLINLIFINHGRAGMVLVVLLSLLTIIQRCTPKVILIGFLLLAGLITGIFYTSENVQTRAIDAYDEITHYHPGRSRTSLGMRFDWWTNSIDLIKQAPITGHGTGSYETVQKEIKKKRTKSTDNPHNEYLFIGVQVGLMGLFTFLALLGWQFALSFKLPHRERHLVQGVVIAMAAGCIANSFLFDSQQGHFYAFLSSVLLASGWELDSQGQAGVERGQA
ncbi:O-antigen ligase [Desulfopila sp. IMCC35008]|uniref:O-antigen ligase family protein n=1 Tax=Desulfopila sp. IMCC35008 TaxID=2653858 RepID=UPI0013D1D67D|nr:O-antigen ligase family protein [Desulfopila sp. IMCC35008]